MGIVHMNKERAGEDRGSKEKDGCPLTTDDLHHPHPQLLLMVRKSMRSRLY
jgi:hypothetical protein